VAIDRTHSDHYELMVLVVGFFSCYQFVYSLYSMPLSYFILEFFSTCLWSIIYLCSDPVTSEFTSFLSSPSRILHDA
jgi:hypothetical protein